MTKSVHTIIAVVAAVLLAFTPAAVTTSRPPVQPGAATQAANGVMIDESPNTSRPRPPSRAPGGTILPLGDSITVGIGPAPQDGGYRSRLATLLTGTGVSFTFVGPALDEQGRAHAGFSGWTIDQLTLDARWWASVLRPRVILVDAGTNDAGRDHNDSAAQMLADLRVLLGELRAGAPASVILLAQPTITLINTPAQQQALRDYGDALPALAAEFGRMWVVDMRGVPIAPADGGDGVHPGPVGYAAMAARWLAGLRAAGLVA